MTDVVLTTIAATGFTVAFLHAAIPTHWLPFVLTARVQKWSRAKTLFITLLAGCGHVLLTAVLGFLVAWGGMTLSDRVGRLFPWIAGGALLLFGLYYIVQQLRGGEHHGHAHAHDHAHGDAGGNRPAATQIGSGGDHQPAGVAHFFAVRRILPVYVSGVKYGWSGFILLTAILSVGTVVGMVLFTWLTLAGMEKLNLHFLEKYERGVLGAVLCILGLLVIFLEH